MLISLCAGIFSLHRESIETLQTNLQMQAQNAHLNERLVQYSKDPGFRGTVMTTYPPMLMIDALRVHTGSLKSNPNGSPELREAIKNERPFCEIHTLISPSNELQYLLLHKHILKPVIDRGLLDGSLRLLFEMDGIRLIRILCPR